MKKKTSISECQKSFEIPNVFSQVYFPCVSSMGAPASENDRNEGNFCFKTSISGCQKSFEIPNVFSQVYFPCVSSIGAPASENDRNEGKICFKNSISECQKSFEIPHDFWHSEIDVLKQKFTSFQSFSDAGALIDETHRK